MPIDPEILKQLMPLFLTETQDYLQALNRLLLDLEKHPDEEARRRLLSEIFRVAHTLKGSARTVRFEHIGALAHSLETLFARVQRGQVPLSTEIFDRAYHAVDTITNIVDKSVSGESIEIDVSAECAALEAIGAESPTAFMDAPSFPETALAPVENTMVIYDMDLEIEVPAPPSASRSAAVAPSAARHIETSFAPHTDAAPREAPAEEIVRLAVSKLDSLFADIGELQVTRIGTDQRLVEMRALLDRIEHWQAQWLHARPAFRRLLAQFEQAGPERARENITDLADWSTLFEFLAANETQLRQTHTGAETLARQLETDSRRMAQVTGELQDDVRRMRMMPAATVFETYPRMVRDLARDLGKQVQLVIQGGTTEIDRLTLEQIKAPLLHLLRNAVDHGIEMPETRERMGKPREGTITLKASQRGGSIIIEITDDGAGIDPNQVKTSAVKKGLITPDDAQAMTEREAMWLIFRSGISTRNTITDISGRGVGMDVVRETIEQLQGVINLDSALGQGTRISLSVPLTVAATLCLLTQVDDEIFAVPLMNVERIVRVTDEQIGYAQGRAVIHDEHRPIVLVPLAEIVETAPTKNKPDTKKRALIVNSAEKRAAFLVDALLGAQEVVIKNLPHPFLRVRYAAGATILGTGQVVVVLNAADLLRYAAREAVRAAMPLPTSAPAKITKTILIADDSITTRTLEKNILEAAGYNVRLAADGAEAWSLLQSEGIAPGGEISLLVSDVNMPRLDGFELAGKVRGDERFKKLPVILVTSLATRQDREHGMQVGADAYIVKGSFDQDDLLSAIRQLI